jgi:hypothetical protein
MSDIEDLLTLGADAEKAGNGIDFLIEQQLLQFPESHRVEFKGRSLKLQKPI